MIRVQFFRSRGAGYPTRVHQPLTHTWYFNLPYTHVMVRYGWVWRITRLVRDCTPPVATSDLSVRDLWVLHRKVGIPVWWMFVPRGVLRYQ